MNKIGKDTRPCPKLLRTETDSTTKNSANYIPGEKDMKGGAEGREGGGEGEGREGEWEGRGIGGENGEEGKEGRGEEGEKGRIGRERQSVVSYYQCYSLQLKLA